MKTFLKVLTFSVVVILFYTVYSRYGIPQIKPSPPPKEEVIELSSMTMEDLIALGEKIFKGKGTCTLCHNPLLGGRAPDPTGMAIRAAERIKDPNYKKEGVFGTGGKADTVEGYLRESMVNPSAYVVPGYGVKGTNDMQSPMPVVTSGAIGLSDVEVDAVIAYLQSSDGMEVTVKIPKETPTPVKTTEVAQAPATASASSPEEVIKKYGCGACHRIADQVGQIGPDLTAIGSKRDKDYIRRAIVDPNADIAPGFMPGLMQKSLFENMTLKELEMLVEYLSKQKG